MYQNYHVTPLSHFKIGTVIGKCVTVEITIGDYKKSNEINPGLI